MRLLISCILLPYESLFTWARGKGGIRRAARTAQLVSEAGGRRAPTNTCHLLQTGLQFATLHRNPKLLPPVSQLLGYIQYRGYYILSSFPLFLFVPNSRDTPLFYCVTSGTDDPGPMTTAQTAQSGNVSGPKRGKEAERLKELGVGLGGGTGEENCIPNRVVALSSPRAANSLPWRHAGLACT